MSEIQKKTLGIAIASLVFGCFILIPILGLLFSLAAIILGIIALVKISKNKDSLKGNGLAIAGVILGGIGIVIVPVMVGILMAIAIPNFMRATVKVNASSAIADLNKIALASKKYYKDKNYYPVELKDLVYPESAYISANLFTPEKGVYDIEIVNTGNNSTFLATAAPKTNDMWYASFCVVEDGVVRIDPDGGEIIDCDSCMNLEAAEDFKDE